MTNSNFDFTKTSDVKLIAFVKALQEKEDQYARLWDHDVSPRDRLPGTAPG